jgi:multicomponent Na+:H+ antiporter subunit A
MAILTTVLSGFVLAAAAPWVHRAARAAAGWLLALPALGLFGWFAVQIGSLPPEGVSFAAPWAPSLGVELSLRLDGLALLFALLISGVGALVLVYAGAYHQGHPELGRLYAYLLLFMASMLGLVLADNVLTLFVFWELTSISSYLLIGFDHDRAEARSAALQALLVTGGGGLALLAGLLLLGEAAGSLRLSDMVARAADVRAHALYLPILLLILLGAFTKSAQFPFHFWLPAAMEAPTAVSAYLHSATMVKAGVYLLARVGPVLGGTDEWLYLVTGFGAVTLLAGAALAVVQSDLKLMLAYSTVSALGALVLLLGVGLARPVVGGAVTAALTFLLAHALYKGALFLVAGAVDHEAGTRDVERLGGLARAMPVTATAALLAGLSMAGVPPLFNFLAKETFYEATQHGPAALVLTVVTVVAFALFVVVAGLVAVRPFLGKKADTPKHPHEAPPGLWLGPVVLAGLGLALGLLPHLVDAPLLSPAVSATVAARVTAPVRLELWHGWSPTLALSIATLAAGVVLYLAWGALRALGQRLEPIVRWGPARWYDLTLAGLNGLARFQTRVLQAGYLRYYLLIVLVTTLGLVGYTLATRGRWQGADVWGDVRFYEAGLLALIVLAALASVVSRSRLGAIAALGVVGYGVALVFVLFGAPDLAMTQFLVETLTVILFVLVFYHLPRGERMSERLPRARDATLAVAVGALMTMLVLAAVGVEFAPPVSDYYAAASVPEGHGRNVVNVILVDFRGLDTLGEITVLSVAAVGVYALLKLRPREGG